MRKSSLFSSLSPQRPPAMTSTIPPKPRAMSPSVGPPMTQICPTGCKKKESRAWERDSGRDCHRGFSLLVIHVLGSSRSVLVSPGHTPPLSPGWTLSGLHLLLNVAKETHRVHSTVGLSALSSAGRPAGHGPCHHSWTTHPLVSSPCPAGVRQPLAPICMNPAGVSPVPSGLEVNGWSGFSP